MHDALFDIDRIVMGRRSRTLETAALVDGHIDEHGARFHRREARPRDQLGRRCPGHKDSPHHEIGPCHAFGRGRPARHPRLDAAGKERIELPKPRCRQVEHGNPGAHSGGDPRGVRTDHPAAEHRHLARTDPGNPGKQRSPPAIRLLQRPRPHLRREPACNFGHRRKKRQMAGRICHRLIGDRGHPRGEQIAGLFRVGREVEIGEEDLALAKPRPFDRLRLLDLHDHFGLGKDVFGGLADPGTRARIVLVGETRTRTRTPFDQDRVAVRHRFSGRHRRQADAVFLGFDLLWTADPHVVSLPTLWPLPLPPSDAGAQTCEPACTLGGRRRG